jgi:SH3-like domain-containing protein
MTRRGTEMKMTVVQSFRLRESEGEESWVYFPIGSKKTRRTTTMMRKMMIMPTRTTMKKMREKVQRVHGEVTAKLSMKMRGLA